ncbi:ABC transporter ATP-binding protein [Kitasatospora sp. NPDC059648]|uniref:ABC transporter ATP-binding protein n=1 Tax=Kitasatospora sp. NPDC059648 TaxID=3346894 RepID=UPI0036ABABD9
MTEDLRQKVRRLVEQGSLEVDGSGSRFGVVLQDSHDHAQLTVSEVLNHFASFYADARDPDELAAAVGLAEKRNSRAAHLSGGQRRRLDVALGLVGRPELLFLDEPTTGFDPVVRSRLWELIERLRTEGTTVVLTTHYLDEVERLADRVGVLCKGQIIDVDTPAHLGGRHVAKAVVGWRDTEGQHWTETSDATRTVIELAGHYSGHIPNLTVSQTSLEDTYLQMIGESA